MHQNLVLGFGGTNGTLKLALVGPQHNELLKSNLFMNGRTFPCASIGSGLGNVLVRSWSTNWAKNTKLAFTKSSLGFWLPIKRN